MDCSDVTVGGRIVLGWRIAVVGQAAQRAKRVVAEVDATKPRGGGGGPGMQVLRHGPEPGGSRGEDGGIELPARRQRLVSSSGK